MTTEANELLPCPFCGKDPKTEIQMNDAAIAYINCRECHFSICHSVMVTTPKDFHDALHYNCPIKEAVKKVIEKWNARA